MKLTIFGNLPANLLNPISPYDLTPSTTATYESRIEILFYVIQKSVQKLQYSAAACIESTNLLKILFSIDCEFSNFKNPNQRAETFKAICEAVPQLTSIIIEEASKDFMTCFMMEMEGDTGSSTTTTATDPTNEVQKPDTSPKLVLANSKTIFAVITSVIAQQNSQKTSALDVVGIPSDQPKEIFTYGETFLRTFFGGL